MKPIPFYDVWDAGLKSSWGDVLKAIRRVLGSKRLLAGVEVAQFERRIARRHGVSHAVAVSSGTDALALALRACGDWDGEQAWTPAFGCPATVAAIRLAGMTERHVDVSRVTGHADTSHYDAALGADDAVVPHAVVPVHLWGRRTNVESIHAWRRELEDRYRRRIYLIEDACQGYGLPNIGTVSDAAAVSFYPTKPLGGIGDGGAVLTNDEALAAQVRALRDYGRPKGTWAIARYGWNARLSEVEAAALFVLERRSDRAWASRSLIASEYRAALRGTGMPVIPADGTPHTDHLFPVRVPPHAREAIRAAMHVAGVGTGIHYTPALPDIPASQDPRCVCPEARAWAAETLSLPIYPGLRGTDLRRVCTALQESIGKAVE